MRHDGFLSCTYGEKLIKDDNGLKNIPLSDDEMDDYNIFMKQYGFVPDYEFDCYVVRNVGAFMAMLLVLMCLMIHIVMTIDIIENMWIKDISLLLIQLLLIVFLV